MKNCCNNWWTNLTEEEKLWIHYYFYDMKKQDLAKRLGVKKMHDFKFELEGRDRLTGE